MGAVIENLTTSEAAIGAGVSVAKINRIIDRRILARKLYSVSESRTVRKDACVDRILFRDRRTAHCFRAVESHSRWASSESLLAGT